MVVRTESAAASPDVLGRVRVRLLSPTLGLAVLVVVSVAVRVAVAWSRSTPNLFPDEYIYTELSRSLAAGHLPEIRGHAAHFPSLLAPLLTAPAWLLHDTASAYRLAQAVGAVAMSLAAIPAFLIARRLQLRPPLAVAVAALALTVPDLLFTSYLVAEPFAYPLALASVAAGLAALERPSWRTQVAFVVLALLTAFARIQFVVLPLAFLTATIVVGVRERRWRQALREQRLVLAIFGVGAGGLAVVGLGFYGDVVHSSIAPVPLAHSLAQNLLVLAFASGWVVVPGAVIGFALGLVRPSSRAELAFAALASSLSLGLLFETILYGTDAHERYLAYVAPLFVLAFARYASRGYPFKLVHVVAAALLIVGAVELPLAGIGGLAHSPVLMAVLSLAKHANGAGSASNIVLNVAIVAMLVLLALVRLPRIATTFALVCVASFGLATWALAANLDLDNTKSLRDAYLPSNPSWVDARGLSHVALVRTYNPNPRDAYAKLDAYDQLFWNRSVDQVLVLSGGVPLDVFSSPLISPAKDGTLRIDGVPLTRPLLIDNRAATIRLRNARRVAAERNFDLWQPVGIPRLALFFGGRSRDGWLSTYSWLGLWPEQGSLRGRVSFALTLPAASPPFKLELRLPGGQKRVVSLRPGHRTPISLRVCSKAPWEVQLLAPSSAGMNDVSARATLPLYVPDAAACIE